MKKREGDKLGVKKEIRRRYVLGLKRFYWKKNVIKKAKLRSVLIRLYRTRKENIKKLSLRHRGHYLYFLYNLLLHHNVISSKLRKKNWDSDYWVDLPKDLKSLREQSMDRKYTLLKYSLVKKILKYTLLLNIKMYLEDVFVYWFDEVSKVVLLRYVIDSGCNIGKDLSRWLLVYYYVLYLMGLGYIYKGLIGYCDRFYYRYLVENRLKRKSRLLSLLQWNSMRGWKKHIRREFELYNKRLGRIRSSLNQSYYMRDKVRGFYGIDKLKDYKKLLGKLSSSGYRIKHNGALSGFISLFELRLSTVAYRLGFVSRIRDSKVLINRGGIKVNGKVEYNEDYVLSVGDIVSVNIIFRDLVFETLMSNLKKRLVVGGVPRYFIANYNILSGLVWRAPKMRDVAYPSKLRLAVVGGDPKMMKKF